MTYLLSYIETHKALLSVYHDGDRWCGRVSVGLLCKTQVKADTARQVLTALEQELTQ